MAIWRIIGRHYLTGESLVCVGLTRQGCQAAVRNAVEEYDEWDTRIGIGYTMQKWKDNAAGTGDWQDVGSVYLLVRMAVRFAIRVRLGMTT